MKPEVFNIPFGKKNVEQKDGKKENSLHETGGFN
jgi:hypothetical protein